MTTSWSADSYAESVLSCIPIRQDSGRRAFRLSRRLTSALQGAAAQCGTEMPELLQAVWAVLLNRTRSEEEAAFVISRRERKHGKAVDSVAVTVSMSADETVAGVARALMDKPRLVDASNADTLIAWDEPAEPTVNHPLTLSVISGDRLTLELRYLRSIVNEDTSRRLSGYLLNLLKGVAVEPSQPLRQLPILSRNERRRVLVEWNAKTEADAPRCVHHLFEEQAARAPNAMAVIFAEQRLSYGELNTRANHLAHHLRSRGVGPDVLVALCLDRSADLLVGILGILKAGGAYVPVDPNYPDDRLAFVLEDAGVTVVLTQLRHAWRMDGRAKHVVCIDDDAVPAGNDANPPPLAAPHHLIYVIYTSGSTGRPKGVAIEHRNVHQLVRWSESQYSREELSAVLFGVTVCFDMSVFEIFLPLCLGGAVVVAENALQVRELAAANEISMMITVPSVAAELLRTGGLPASLQTINVGGEALSDALVHQLYAHPQVRRVYNLYGPTETTVTVTVYPVTRDVVGAPSIGGPIRGARLYVLDDQRQPVPIGCPGELYIGGLGVAREYLNRPDLTAQRFLPDPFALEPGARMYRSGDLCRFRSNGDIDYLGRIDQQVKVRGFRVELGEIESVLGQHPAVASCTVIASREVSTHFLTAYVIFHPGRDETPAGLRQALKEKLPDYMVPTRVVRLEAWPLTPNGKIDRKALPKPPRIARDECQLLVPPRTDPERALLPLWETVLGLAPLSVTDNFFDLGGDSYHAASLIGKIRTELGHLVPLSALYTAPTIQKLGAMIQQDLEVGSNRAVVPFQEGGTQPPLFLVAGVGGHVFTFHRFARLLGCNQPTYGLKAIGVDGARPPLSRIEDIAATYLQEILTLRPGGPYILGGYSIGALVAFELALQMTRRGHRVKLLVVFDMYAPTYPKKLPLLPRIGKHVENFARLPWSERKTYLRERFNNARDRIIHKLGLGAVLAPPVPGAEGLPREALKQVWAGLMKAQARYRPNDRLDTDVLLFKAREDRNWTTTIADNPLMGWDDWCTGKIEIHPLGCAHLEVFQDNNIGEVARKLSDAIQVRLKARIGGS